MKTVRLLFLASIALSPVCRAQPEITREVIRSAVEMGGPEFLPVLLKLAAGKDQSVRLSALEALVSRPEWTGKMLEAIKSGQLSAAGFPVSLRRSLATSPDAALRELATATLGAWNESASDVKALIAAKKKACLTGEPDLANGRLLFTATCATCHKFHGGGQEVGPELIGSGRSNLDAILANVIDPNQIIGNGYENVIVTGKDGRAMAGRVVEDTPTQVTLLGIGGTRTVVPRGDIAGMENTKQSLMPMGFGALPDDQFRDLIWYILAPPEEGPLTKEKKEHLLLSVDAPPAPDAPKAGGLELWNPKMRDREAASLWQPDWQLDAADFEGTPTRLVEYCGRKNVLVLHPKSANAPAALVREFHLPADKPVKVSVHVASHDGGDWEVRASCNGKPLPGNAIISHKPDARWQLMTWDLSAFQGKKVTLRLKNYANGWSNEFSFWSDLRVE